MQRPMRLLCAFEAPVAAASLAHNVCLLHRRVLYNVGTAWRRTPLSLPVDLNKALLKVPFVLKIRFFITELLEQILRNDQLAALLRTGSSDDLRTKPNLTC